MDGILVLPLKYQESIVNYMPSPDMLIKLANFFSVFGDVTRIKILTALCISDMCVNDLSIMLRLNQTTVSHQLKNLRQCGIVAATRQGKIVYYKLTNQAINDIMLNGVNYLMAN